MKGELGGGISGGDQGLPGVTGRMERGGKPLVPAPPARGIDAPPGGIARVAAIPRGEPASVVPGVNEGGADTGRVGSPTVNPVTEKTIDVGQVTSEVVFSATGLPQDEHVSSDYRAPQAAIGGSDNEQDGNTQRVNAAQHDAGRDDTEGGGEATTSDYSSALDTPQGRLITTIFNPSQTVHFPDAAWRAGLDVERLPDVILKPDMLAVVSEMLEEPVEHRMPLGIILSQVSLDQLPDDITGKINSRPAATNISVETTHETWKLCDTSESLLAKSIEETGAIVLEEGNEPYFLVKMRGKMTGLCLQNVTTPNRKVFLEGNWYSPIDERFSLQDAFEANAGRVALPEGRWAFMRPLKPTDEKSIQAILEEAQQAAQSIPSTYPHQKIFVDGNYMTRSKYRSTKGELYPPY